MNAYYFIIFCSEYYQNSFNIRNSGTCGGGFMVVVAAAAAEIELYNM